MRYLIFGDSLAYGAWDNEGGWVERLKRDAHKQTVDSQGQTKYQVINLGVGGDTSIDILARMENEIKARYSASWPFSTIVSIGVNDSCKTDGQINVSLDQYQENLENIFNIAKRHSNEVYFVDTPPLLGDDVKFKNHGFSDTRVKKYMDVARELSAKKGVKFIEVRDKFDGFDLSGYFAYDSLHPNGSGHEIIYQSVRDAIWPDLE